MENPQDPTPAGAQGKPPRSWWATPVPLGDRANLIGLGQLSRRTLISAARTTFYGVVATMFAINHAETAQLLDAAILGAVLADYVTWLVRSLMQLPENLLHGGYDAIINLAFACFFFQVAHFEITDDGSAVAAAFMTFMLVLGVKAGYYGLQSVQKVMSED